MMATVSLEHEGTAILRSPDGTRRPHWLLRPLKPGREAYALPGPRFGP
jgi:hypothetical protein